MKNKLSFIIDAKFYSKEIFQNKFFDSEEEILVELNKIIEELNKLGNLEFFVFEDSELNISYGLSIYDKTYPELIKYEIEENKVLLNNEDFCLLHEADLNFPNGVYQYTEHF